MKKHPCIMTVDDEQIVLKLLSHIFEPEGYDVIVADNGTVALELFEEHMPDLVILDIIMPVIMLTANNEVNTARDALVLGADDYVRKPFGTQELLARIRAKLRRAEAKVTMSAPVTGLKITAVASKTGVVSRYRNSKRGGSNNFA